jgi:hypothetical protein
LRCRRGVETMTSPTSAAWESRARPRVSDTMHPGLGGRRSSTHPGLGIIRSIPLRSPSYNKIATYISHRIHSERHKAHALSGEALTVLVVLTSSLKPNSWSRRFKLGTNLAVRIERHYQCYGSSIRDPFMLIAVHFSVIIFLVFEMLFRHNP